MTTRLHLRASILYGSLAVTALWPCAAQEDGLTIRVEARQVLVPFGWGGYAICTPARKKEYLRCSWDGAVNDHISRDAESRGDLRGPDDYGFLSLKDLRLFEDGKEQQIEGIEKATRNIELFEDNLGKHKEGAWVPTGIWSTSDRAPSPSRQTRADAYYQIAYSPPVSTEGSCHSIRLTGPHESKLVYRKEYCFVTHSTADLLKGTQEDQKLEGYLAAGRQGNIHPRMQASAFFEAPGKTRVHVDVELPFDEVKPKDLRGWAMPVDLLILAYGIDGRVVARHSELVPADKDAVSPWGVPSNAMLDWASISFTFVRYDAQIELAPGKYKFAFAFSHGPDFGIAEIPLAIENYDGSQFAISSIALCKRVRKAGEKPIAKDFVPLVAGGDEFTPAADTDFRNGDTLMTYFELYEPNSEQPQQALHVNYTMRITNQQTGAVALQRAENADFWLQPGKSTIPIAEKLVLSQLHLTPGKYRFEIQATDSAGRSTPLRAAEFWVD